MTDVPETLPEQLDEQRNLVVELKFPAIACKGWFLLQNTSGVCGKHEDEFLDLPILLHLSLEAVHHELTVEFCHSSPDKLI